MLKITAAWHMIHRKRVMGLQTTDPQVMRYNSTTGHRQRERADALPVRRQLLATGIADAAGGHWPVQLRRQPRGALNIKRSLVIVLLVLFAGLVILLTALLLVHLVVSRYAAG
jgi:hypothetical protein